MGLGFIKTEDSHRVIADEEVRSKYFDTSQKKKTIKKPYICNKPEYHPTKQKNTMPEETRLLLEKLDLSSDFLCSDSDT